MAKPVSDAELQLRKRARRRLVGAVVLVLLVVVFLPMVLDEERKPLPGNVVIQIPPTLPADKAFPPASGGTSALPAVPASPADPPAQKPPASPGADAAVGPQVTEKPEVPPQPPASGTGAKPESSPPPPPEPASRQASTPEPSPHPGTEAKADASAAAKAPVHRDSPPEAAGFVVQLGAFSKPDNARALLERLRKARIPGYVETLRTPSGTKTRVLAGPYATEAAALKDRDRMLALKLASGELKVGRKGD